ncbi:MAG: flagellar biosynthesis anti-sigma factor FlgM [Planctomycetaceae bacterium]|nr:flagellar biosynthesis anti-sigma factor FlgM [Planctomycetaceae bacterium]
MFSLYDADSLIESPLAPSFPSGQPLLKRSLILRYDRPHAGASTNDDQQRAAVQPTVVGEADMEVTGPGAIGGSPSDCQTERPSGPRPTAAGAGESGMHDETATPNAGGGDQSASDTDSMRAARLARIQKQIAAGTYETADKLEIAVERLLNQLR